MKILMSNVRNMECTKIRIVEAVINGEGCVYK